MEAVLLALRRLASRLRHGLPRRARRLWRRLLPPPPLPSPWQACAEPGTLPLRVLILAEASIPQCLRYRVLQKVQLFTHLGVPCTWLPWQQIEPARAALQTHSLLIIYRVPATEHVRDLLEEAHRLGLPTWWEVDDLVFDRPLLASSETLLRLDRTTYEGLLRGADLYRATMLACSAAIASTEGLAQAMRLAGVERVGVVENALDAHTLALAEQLLAERAAPNANANARAVASAEPGPEPVRILYGSGTNTHDVDVEQAAGALLRLLHDCPTLVFQLVGPVKLPAAFERLEPAVAARVQRLEGLPYADYLRLLAAADISIAPLEPGVFNDAKSSIKFLEAAVVGVPSVCSPSAAFCAAIRSGEDGWLCSTPEEWYAALHRLVNDAALRRRIGATARRRVLRRWAPEAVAREQLAPLLAPLQAQAAATRARLLLVPPLRPVARRWRAEAALASPLLARWAGRSGLALQLLTPVPLWLAPAGGLRRGSPGRPLLWGLGLSRWRRRRRLQASLAELPLASGADLLLFEGRATAAALTLARHCRDAGVAYALRATAAGELATWPPQLRRGAALLLEAHEDPDGVLALLRSGPGP